MGCEKSILSLDDDDEEEEKEGEKEEEEEEEEEKEEGTGPILGVNPPFEMRTIVGYFFIHISLDWFCIISCLSWHKTGLNWLK